MDNYLGSYRKSCSSLSPGEKADLLIETLVLKALTLDFAIVFNTDSID